MIYIEPILFLDLDGVMVTTPQFFMKRRHPKFNSCFFDAKCVKVLNEIITKSNATIILSSDWKTHYCIEELNEIFKDNGVIKGIDGITPDLWGIQFYSLQQLEECRSAEILAFVNEHSIKKFVAVDDLNLSQWLPDNFVRCAKTNEGIKQSSIKDKILKIIL